MNPNPGWVHAHLRVVIVTLAVCVSLSVFFLAPVIYVITVGCANDWESPSYYFYKIGYHLAGQPINGCY